MRSIGATFARLGLIGLTFLSLLLGAGAAYAQSKSLHIAMANSFVTGRSQTVIDIATDDFKVVLRATTGFEGDLSAKLDAFEIADKLDKKQLDFGIFHAHEFAWIQQKHQDLQP